MKSEKRLKTIPIRLFLDDLEYLRLAYPTGGYNRVVRALVARHVRSLRNRTVELIDNKLSEDELEAV